MNAADKIDTGGRVREQLEIVYNNSIDIMFLVSVEPGNRYHFTSVNNAFLSATGLQREQVEGKYVDEVIPPSSYSFVLAKYNEAVQQKGTMQWEETTGYPAGKKTGIVSITPVFNEQDICIMLVGTVHDITERKITEEESEKMRYQLNERVKELTTLYRVSQLLHSETKSQEDLLEEMVNILPQGWQYPGITAARIVLNQQEFKTPNYGAALYRQTATFPVADNSEGMIEIVYLEERPAEDEGPFLAEERNLINMLADMLRMLIARRRTAEQLLKQKELSESIINSLPGIFYLFDATGQYLLWNKNHETVPGYSTEEMKTMYPLNFFDDDEKEMIKERIEKVFTEGYAEAEAYFMAKDGRKIPYYFNGIALNYNNKPCLMGVGIDITERKKMETELRDAEIKFRTLVEKSQVGVYIVQRGKFSYVNPRFAEIFGYEQDELIGVDPVKTIIAEEYQPVSAEHVRARLEGEVETVHYEAVGKKKDGTTNRIEFYGSRTFYEGQTTIIGTMVDITERKIAEEALQKSEANLHTVFDTTDTVYTLLNTNFQVVSYNQQAADFARNELDKDLHIGANLINYFPKERLDNIFENMKRVLQGETIQYESSYEQPDRSFHWYDVRMLPVRDNPNNIFGLIIALSDITEKKVLEQQILSQRVEGQKKITRAVLKAQEKERNLIGQELHDNVNQILAGAKMFLGLTSKGGNDNEELIKKSVTLIDNAVNEIRALTRDQVTPQKKIHLKDLIQSLVDKLNDLAHLKTTFNYDVGKVVINDDLKLNIYRIIQEGINNILKHASARSAVINVKAERKTLFVSIVDDGKGLDTTKKYKGVGINNILNRVDSYNGRIAIDSGPEKGCKIELAIPL